jgi:hypothetical protein
MLICAEDVHVSLRLNERTVYLAAKYDKRTTAIIVSNRSVLEGRRGRTVEQRGEIDPLKGRDRNCCGYRLSVRQGNEAKKIPGHSQVEGKLCHCAQRLVSVIQSLRACRPVATAQFGQHSKK